MTDKSRFPELLNDAVSFHMPGHKGRLIFFDVPNDFLKYDVTELPGMDNLLQPDGWIRDLSDRISKFYGSTASRISVGGSSAGILSAILGVSKYYEAPLQNTGTADCVVEGAHISNKNCAAKKCKAKKCKALINKNAHISVYNAMDISGREVLTIAPEETRGVPSHFDTSVFKELLSQNVNILVLTYPFYQGGLYDLKSLIEIARRERPEITIIVDEAHGAHLVLAERVHNKKISALSLGADIVIQSFHKTLPALGQAAVLHYGRTKRGRELAAHCERMHSIEWYLKALQTTSPSYLMLRSIYEMMEILESRGVELYRRLSKNVERFYAKCGLKPFDYGAFAVQDESKILLPYANQRRFIDKGIYPEMETDAGILFLSSIANTEADFERLAAAVCEIPRSHGHPEGTVTVRGRSDHQRCEVFCSHGHPERKLFRYGAEGGESGEYVEISAKDAVGRRSAETLVLYPPGSPVISEGEVFKKEAAALLGTTKVKVYL